jgi:hypothetical protein
MTEPTTFLQRLAHDDLDWLLGAHERRHLAAGDDAVAGSGPDALHVVIGGALGVLGPPDRPSRVIGPGEVVGEPSSGGSAGTVVALESSTVITVSGAELRRRTAGDLGSARHPTVALGRPGAPDAGGSDGDREAALDADAREQALRSRRALAVREIHRDVWRRGGLTAHVTGLACGHAREVFEVYETLPDPALLEATLVDVDQQALAGVSARRDRRNLQRSITILTPMALSLADAPVPEQDLVYSIGVADHLPDTRIVELIDLAHALLRPGGRLLLGATHPADGCRASMHHVVGRPIIHRRASDLDRLFRASLFARRCTDVHADERGIGMLAECVKA